eukprot:XP_022267958.1 carboxypeptidase Q isoform X3 [Canis lupus familiaris]
MEFLLFTFVGVVHLLSLSSGKPIYKNDISRRTFQEIKEEIASYGDVAKAIIDLAVYGKAQNRSYERLALLVDTVGPRPSGSRSLEKAIQIMYQNLREDGLENVHLEPVKIPHWERGEESAVMLEPRIHRMAILGLGSSIGTPPEGITAEVLVVTSFEELQRRAPEARGKIVVYNQPYVNYSTTVQYRVQGAVEAAKVGALASLIRSVASFSIYSPHTGIQEYQDGVPKIPTACITVEDAEMMSRMASRGNRIVIQLKMGAKNYPDADSFNTVAEIIGSKYPEQNGHSVKIGCVVIFPISVSDLRQKLSTSCQRDARGAVQAVAAPARPDPGLGDSGRVPCEAAAQRRPCGLPSSQAGRALLLGRTQVSERAPELPGPRYRITIVTTIPRWPPVHFLIKKILKPALIM